MHRHHRCRAVLRAGACAASNDKSTDTALFNRLGGGARDSLPCCSERCAHGTGTVPAELIFTCTALSGTGSKIRASVMRYLARHRLTPMVQYRAPSRGRDASGDALHRFSIVRRPAGRCFCYAAWRAASCNNTSHTRAYRRPRSPRAKRNLASAVDTLPFGQDWEIFY